MSTTSTARALSGSALTGAPAEDQVHALAQVPARVRLEIPVEASERPRLELLARAYEVTGRAVFIPSTATKASRNEPSALATQAHTTFAGLVENLYREHDPPAPCDSDASVLTGHRVGLITNLPAPYRIPLFGRLANRLSVAGVELRVFFLGERTSSRPWIEAKDAFEFESEVLRGFDIPVRARRPSIPRTLERRLAAFAPTILVSGGFSPLVSGRARAFARRARIAFGVWSGEHPAMATAQSTVRRIQRRRLLAATDFAIAYGSASACYLRELNPELPVVIGRNTSATNAPRARNHGSIDRVEIVAVADLASPRKGVDILIDALGMVPSLACRLTVIGGGRMLGSLQKRAEADNRIRFLGPLEPAVVRSEYGAADLFAFPSRSDVFGLALVEAMGSGLPVVTSSAPGAVADLCVDGENAIVLTGHRPEEWAGALARLVEDTALRESLGRRASITISRRWTIDHAVEAMTAGLRLGALVSEARNET